MVISVVISVDFGDFGFSGHRVETIDKQVALTSWRSTQSLAWTFSPQPASSSGSSHSTSLSKPSDPGLTRVQCKKKKKKKKQDPPLTIIKVRNITKMPEWLSNSYSVFRISVPIIHYSCHITEAEDEVGYP